MKNLLKDAAYQIYIREYKIKQEGDTGYNEFEELVDSVDSLGREFLGCPERWPGDEEDEIKRTSRCIHRVIRYLSTVAKKRNIDMVPILEDVLEKIKQQS